MIALEMMAFDLKKVENF